MSIEVIVAVIGAGAALIGTIVGGAVSLFATKAQLKAASRQIEVDQLRRTESSLRSCSKINEMRTRRFSRPLNRCAVSRRLSLALALLSDFFDRANAPALARRPWTLPRPSGGTLERQVTGCHAGAWEPSSSPPPRGTRPPVAGQQERRRPGLFGAEKKRPSC